MSTRLAISLSFVAALLAVVLVPALASASPLGQVTTIFDDALKLFLTRIVPGLAIAVIAWNGLMIAMGRKTLMDSIPVVAGAAMALLATVIVTYLSSGAN